jgi:hypothetical protein
MPQTIQLPERCRANLMKLYQDKEIAKAQAQGTEAIYNTAVNSAITVLGLDPQDDNELNLDTGVITLAEKKEAP